MTYNMSSEPLCLYLLTLRRQLGDKCIFVRQPSSSTQRICIVSANAIGSGVLLNMEVGIRKRAWHTCIRYTLLIYDH